MRAARLETDEVPARAPRVHLVVEQIRRGEGRGQPELVRHDAETLAPLVDVEVDDRDDRVVAPSLRVRDQVVVLRLEPDEVLEALQGRMGSTDLVQPPISGSSGPASVRFLTSYFSESRYSSLPARTGTFSHAS